MKTLNLDDFGGEYFTPERLQPLMSWHRGKTVDPRRYRQRFNLRHGYNEKDPYMWTERLADWRRMERIYHRTLQDLHVASEAQWEFYNTLWAATKKCCGPQAKKLDGFLLQDLKPGKRTSSYLRYIHKCNYAGKDSLASTHKDKKELKGQDPTVYWGWLGTPEEEEASRLDRRAEQVRMRHSLATVAFNESVKIRLATWWKHQAEARGDSEWAYRQRKVFTAIENDGRSYGWISSCGGPGELVWSPEEPPTFFK